LALAVAAASCVAPAVADAAIVYSGIIDETISLDSGASSVTIPISGTSADFNLSFFFGKPPGSLTLYTSDDEGLVSTATNHYLARIGVGDTVGSSPASGTAYQSEPNVEWTDFVSPGGYFGFDVQLTGGGTGYGYGLLNTSSNDQTITLVGYAYDNSGAPIVVSSQLSAPEPGTWTMMLIGVGFAGAVLRSRREAGLSSA
jgi:hypothetical protein